MHGQLQLVVVIELNDIRLCVQSWVRVGLPNRVPLDITFLSSYLSPQ
jgi:hypothetical protein